MTDEPDNKEGKREVVAENPDKAEKGGGTK